MGSIAIVGLGYDEREPLPKDTADRLRGASRVVVPSDEGLVAEALKAADIEFVSLEKIGLSIDMPVERIIEGLVELSVDGRVAYATAGYPFLKEGLLAGLLSKSAGTLDVYPTLSPLQVILMAFDIDLTADLDIVDVGSLAPSFAQRDSHLIVTGVTNQILARKASEQLASVYPSDHRVVVAGSLPDGGLSLALYTVAHLSTARLGKDAALYVAPSQMIPPSGFEEFVRLIAVLRSPDGCPWDRAQDHISLRRNMIEEAYEAVAAIEMGQADALADELGDVLLQVVLHSQIAAEDGEFTIDDVLSRIAAKIRRRHPHVFADSVASTPAEVHERWDAIKRDEKADSALIEDVPRSLPALMRAQKISRRVVGVGFEWDTLDDIWEKFAEEIEELKATEPGSPEAAEEIGDLFFTLVNLARKQGIDSEEALRGTCDKFTSRWRSMEHEAAERGVRMEELDIDEMERMWRGAKVREHSSADSENIEAELGEE